ncbi:hypothetical protein BC828DRAFT_380102 [Blastocladiella britannica]|nr:hypothetical protein BC828DRAFT_380102 [Blastocladiella britannica]
MDASLLIILLLGQLRLGMPWERHTRSAGDESDSRCSTNGLWVIMASVVSSAMLAVVSASVGTPLILLPLSSRAIALGGGSDP